MLQHVTLQMDLLPESTVTHGARERLFSRVYLVVFSQVAFLAEPLSTQVARVSQHSSATSSLLHSSWEAGRQYI